MDELPIQPGAKPAEWRDPRFAELDAQIRAGAEPHQNPAAAQGEAQAVPPIYTPTHGRA
jgi:hypothetical protein